MKNTCSVMAFLVLLLASGAAAAQTEDISSPKLRIPWDEFKKLYDSKDAVLVDVRGADAFEAGHIPGSRSVPLEQVQQHIEDLRKLEKPIVFYCA